MDIRHNVRRAILFLALITVLAWAAYGHETGIQCYTAHLTPDGHAYLVPKTCTQPTPKQQERSLGNKQPKAPLKRA